MHSAPWWLNQNCLVLVQQTPRLSIKQSCQLKTRRLKLTCGESELHGDSFAKIGKKRWIRGIRSLNRRIQFWLSEIYIKWALVSVSPPKMKTVIGLLLQDRLSAKIYQRHCSRDDEPHGHEYSFNVILCFSDCETMRHK